MGGAGKGPDIKIKCQSIYHNHEDNDYWLIRDFAEHAYVLEQGWNSKNLNQDSFMVYHEPYN